MLKILDKNKVPIKGLRVYKDLCIEGVLDLDDRTLSFSAPTRNIRGHIVNEGYIETKEDRFVVKEIKKSSAKGWSDIVAQLDMESLEGNAFRSFQTTGQTIRDALQLAFAGTGWTIGECTITKRRTLSMTNVSAMKILEQALKTYRAEVKVHSKEQVIDIYEQVGEDRGVYFSSQLNLKELSIQSSSYDFYTEIEPYGKDGLTIEEINDGKNYLSDYDYSPKKKRYIWKDERYTDPESLKEDAGLKLRDLSRPYVSYSAKVADLASASKEKYSILGYGIGDTVTLMDSMTDTREKQRITGIKRYPEEPHRNTCVLANKVLSFDELTQKYETAANTVENITNDNGQIDGDAIDGIYSKQIYDLENAIVQSATIVDLTTKYLNVTGELNAVKGRFGELETNVLEFETAYGGKITALEGNFTTLNGEVATFKTTITQTLDAASAKINLLDVESERVKTLLAGNITAANMAAGAITAGSGIIAEGAIGDAEISALSANKIRSGVIDTALVDIIGADNRMRLHDGTLQISDANHVRVQIGKDASNDYSMSVWDAAGNLIWDALGATENTIQRKIIRDKMVADDAAIQALKIDFQSFNTAMTDQGVTISGTVVQVGNKTLNVALSEQTQLITEHGQTLTDHSTRITANENSIRLKVDSQTYAEDKTTINASIASSLAEAKGYTNAQITTVNTALSKATADITVLQGQITSKVEQTDIDTAVENIQIGGRNLLQNSESLEFNAYSGSSVTKESNITVSEWSTSEAKRIYGTRGTSQLAVLMSAHVQRFPVAGEIYVGSIYIKNNGENTIWAGRSNSATASNMRATIAPGESKRFQFTYTPATTTTVLQMQIYVSTSGEAFDITYWRPKWEKGNKATDWTPAPEDTETDIADSLATATQRINTAKTEIKQTTDSISQSVTSLQSTVAKKADNSTVTELTSRVSAAESKLTKDSLVTTIGTYYATQTALDTTNGNVTTAQNTADSASTAASNAQTTANNAYNLANAKGIDYSQGKMLHTDPMFASGVNNCKVYNNSSNGTVTVTRTVKSSDNPMTGTSYELTVKTAGNASPGLGGYVQYITSRANAVFIRRIIAKIPTGYTLNYAQNSMGSGYTVQWLTPNAGTGKFTEYVYKYVCGPSGTFSDGGHVYLSGTPYPTASSPVTWYVAYSTTFDMTNVSDIVYAQTIATQTSEKFNWIVKSGTSATDFTLTDRTATLIASAINLKGLVSFSGLDSAAQSKITTAQSTADTAKANAATAQATANTANSRATYHFGTCATAAGTRAKVVTLSGFTLYTGAIVNVKFTYACAGTSGVIGEETTLNVNNTGARTIYVYGAALNWQSAYGWVAGATVQFVYDGSRWVMTDTSAMRAMADWCYNNDRTYINGGKIYAGTVAAAQIAAGAITTVKLAANAVTAAKIDVANLFAQDITATGTIRGVNLVGAKGSFSGAVTAGEGTIGGWDIGDSAIVSKDKSIVLASPQSNSSGQFTSASGITIYNGNASVVSMNKSGVTLLYGSGDAANCLTMTASSGSLTLNGDIKSYGANAAHFYAKTSSRQLALQISSAGNAGLYDNTYGKWLIWANSSGSISSNASDRRLKNDYGVISREHSLALLRGIAAHEFSYKADTQSVRQYGFMAQDVRDILINAGIGYRSLIQMQSATDDNIYTDLKMSEDRVTYSLDYSKFVPILHDGWQYHDGLIADHEQRLLTTQARLESIQGITQSNQQRVSSVESEVQANRRRIAELEALNAMLQAQVETQAEQIRQLQAAG